MNLALLRLFFATEPGDKFWTTEVSQRGAEEVVERIESESYVSSKRSFERVRKRLQERSATSLEDEVGRSGGEFVTRGDAKWPHALDDLLSPPLGIIIKGSPPRCDSVALVGTRNPTQYGARIASEFSSGFVDRGLEIISGGAYGIDTHAHRGAIAAEGRTTAILASGISVRYPAGNERLFEEILANGSLISEVMPNEKARPERFLTRNRLIAALSRATIVIEAAFRSGSLRTAHDASELMKVVLAVPGPITSPTSDGCHRLIGQRCAEIVTSVSDAMEFLPQSACTLCIDDA
jgi:DNA processing protein